jgi:hypothetical protein
MRVQGGGGAIVTILRVFLPKRTGSNLEVGALFHNLGHTA